MHRAMIAWFHAAHHVTKGTGFGGDHVNIYGEIYTTLDTDLDGIVEKGIGLTGDETLADPVSSLSMAAGLLFFCTTIIAAAATGAHCCCCRC